MRECRSLCKHTSSVHQLGLLDWTGTLLRKSSTVSTQMNSEKTGHNIHMATILRQYFPQVIIVTNLDSFCSEKEFPNWHICRFIRLSLQIELNFLPLQISSFLYSHSFILRNSFQTIIVNYLLFTNIVSESPSFFSSQLREYPQLSSFF